MLNELVQAARSLPPTTPTLNNALKALPKSASYRVLIATDGTVTGVTPWDEEISALRKWQSGGNGFSFPTFNAGPLFRPILAEAELDAIKANGTEYWPSVFAAIQTACDDFAGTWMEKTNPKRGNSNCVVKERYRKSLENLPADLLGIMKSFGESHGALQELASRLGRRTAEFFFLSLAETIERQLARSFDARLLKLYCATSKAEADKSFNILLDIADWSDLGVDAHPVVSPETYLFLNQVLQGKDNSDDRMGTDGALDAYGQTANRVQDKFADINTALGKIILRAMTKDAPCQFRYGKADADSFLVGETSRRQAKGALEFLTQEARRGKTWQFRGGNLILIYPESDLPELFDIEAADFCSLPDDTDDDAALESTFVARAQRIAQAFDGKPLKSEVLVHLVVLRKPDGHRTKLVNHQFFTMTHLIDAAGRWQAGVAVCPSIRFARWGKDRGTRDDILPGVPFPGEVVTWLNTCWIRDGTEQIKVSAFDLEDALTLLLADDGTERSLALRAIRQANGNWSGYLAKQGARQHSADVLGRADKRDSAPLSKLPSILSLLLNKLGHTKEQIMTSPAFLIGRLLALADALHFQYCLGVRSGSTPPQLLGNALMQTALETPQSALALYGQRILPYQAWAKTCSVPHAEHSPERLAKSLLAQLAEACSETAQVDLPERTSDADKAQMILGYLAKTKSDD